MGIGRLPRLAQALTDAGRPGDEPAAVVERGTLPGQRTVVATLATIADRAAAEGIRPPAVTIVGRVTAERERLAWLEQRPLHGRTVAVTRARAQASGLAARLRGLGAEVVETPAIRIEPLAVNVPDLAPYDLICLTSPNGVRLFFERLEGDARDLAGKTVAAIGPGTARALRDHGIEPDVVPERSVAESLLEALAGVPASRALVARAREARDVLPDGLRKRGIDVDVFALYETVAEPLDDEAPGRGPRRRPRHVHVLLDGALPAGGHRRRTPGRAHRLDRAGDQRDAARERDGARCRGERARHRRAGRGAGGILGGVRIATAALAALSFALLVAAPASAQAPRACNPGETGGAKTPAEVDSESVGKVDQALVVGHKYKIARVIENAIGTYPDGSPYRQSTAKDGTIVVTASPGVTLTDVPESNDFRGGYQFTAPRAKSVTFTVTWTQELEAQSGASAGECQATATITLPVFALKQARVTRVQYLRHRIVRVGGQYYVSDDGFQLVVLPAGAPADPAPVYVVVRVRTGRAVAPSATGPVFRRVLLSRLHMIRKGGMELDDVTVDGPHDTFLTGVSVGLGAFVPQGKTVRFGFSVSIVQGGRVLGGMRSGAVCRIGFSSRANRHWRLCSARGFAKHP